MKPMTVLNRLLGLRPFDDPSCKPRILLSLLYLLFLWCLVTCFVLHILTLETSNEAMGKYINFLYLYPYVACSYYLTLMGFYHSKTFLVYKKRMLKVDWNLYRLGVTVEYRGLFVSSMILIIAWFLVFIISYGVSINAYISLMGVSHSIYLVSASSYVSSVGAVILLDFVICVKSVKGRFEKVNDLLEVFAADGFQTQERKSSSRSLLPVIPLRTNNWRRSRINVTSVEDLSRVEEQWEYIENRTWRLKLIKLVHLDLCQASNLLFKTFGAQVTVQIMLGIMTITLNLYDIYVDIVKSSFNAQSVISNIWSISLGIVEFGKLFLLSRACDHACREADKALIIAHKYYSTVIDIETKDEIRQFVLQISHCQQGCTKRHFSGLNYSFLFKCVSTVTTYLVILIQFDQSVRPKYTPAMVNNSITDAHKDP